ncbi:hypothetical protein EI555_018645 [Monodon monoceros]|uniref:Cytochrome b n=1 Tax=Monodon monoceros TaxID=40151 RepID=A0A4V5PBA2_MONMO|nr:hypothetical protein EI555_018645 [Monodon monoceros]
MMDLWFSLRHLFSSTHLDRLIPSNTLYIRYSNCIFMSNISAKMYSHSIHRLCLTLRTNSVLRSDSYYQSSLSNSLYRHKPCGMNLRRQNPISPLLYKDILGVLSLILILVVFSSDLPGDPDNYTAANPLNTAPHIKPE